MSQAGYSVHKLPDGRINYVYRTPKRYDPGHAGYLGFTKICNTCGCKRNTVACPCTSYYHVEYLTKEEFENRYEAKQQKALVESEIYRDLKEAQNKAKFMNSC